MTTSGSIQSETRRTRRQREHVTRPLFLRRVNFSSIRSPFLSPTCEEKIAAARSQVFSATAHPWRLHAANRGYPLTGRFGGLDRQTNLAAADAQRPDRRVHVTSADGECAPHAGLCMAGHGAEVVVATLLLEGDDEPRRVAGTGQRRLLAVDLEVVL